MNTQSNQPKVSSRFAGFATAATMMLVTSLAAAAGQGQQAKTAATLGDEDLAKVGKETIERTCTTCHGTEQIFDSRRTPSDWHRITKMMSDLGANASDDELATIRRYLLRYYGRVPVNTATAEEIAAVLGLSTSEAQAIVEYRNANGKFSDASALTSVPGIDKAKIEPSAVSFQ